jgi:tripartite-type tricarboxylate transporter receptor subunit TctC
LFPELPTVAEAGVPGFEVTVWTGVVAPAGLRKPTLARLNAEINKACAAPALLDRYEVSGNRCPGGTPEQFREFYRQETMKRARVIKTAGIKAE